MPPAEYVIDKERGIVFSRAWGELIDEDVAAHDRRLRADPAFDPQSRQLVDLSPVERFGLTPDGIRRFASGDPWGPGARRAFIAPADVAFGMARMHEMLMDEAPQEISVFRTVREARFWLGLDESDPDPFAPR